MAGGWSAPRAFWLCCAGAAIKLYCWLHAVTEFERAMFYLCYGVAALYGVVVAVYWDDPGERHVTYVHVVGGMRVTTRLRCPPPPVHVFRPDTCVGGLCAMPA
jgi:hypothetical protein